MCSELHNSERSLLAKNCIILREKKVSLLLCSGRGRDFRYRLRATQSVQRRSGTRRPHFEPVDKRYAIQLLNFSTIFGIHAKDSKIYGEKGFKNAIIYQLAVDAKKLE